MRVEPRRTGFRCLIVALNMHMLKLEPEVGIVTDLTMEVNSKIRTLCIFAALQYVSSADLWITSDSIACCS